MTEQIYEVYLRTLREELVPAMGCTEPIAIAYAAARCRETLGAMPESVVIRASANIIKNVKSVVVPNTGGKRGIAAAAAAGIVSGRADKELQVLSCVSEKAFPEIDRFMREVPCEISQSEKPYVFHIQVILTANGHLAEIEIAGQHTNIIYLALDGAPIIQNQYEETVAEPADRYLLTVEDIIEFADTVKLDDVRDILSRQIEYNTAIAREGLSGKWGAQVGKTILRAYGEGVHNKAKAYAAAGSDARMNGCELPVIINSGSGNQGMTASLPVIVYAEEMGASEDLLYRALVVSNLVTIHMKTDIGRLSAYCGATSAGCGAGAGICYLHGGKKYEISHTIVNAVAINSGMICDGAKPGCALKVTSGVSTAIFSAYLAMQHSYADSTEGIVEEDIDRTIRNLTRIGHDGMQVTDDLILDIMTHKQ